MPETGISFAIFIDYDNLLIPQKTAGILDIVTRTLLQLPMDKSVDFHPELTHFG